ncbi:MAG: hypothetical protein WCG06_02170, partial [Candidatus Omnitrophota bacterium]
IKYPQGRFVFEADVSKIAFVSGGIGITPIRSICRDIADRALGTDVVLVYGNNSIDEIAFRDDLEAMRAHSDRFKVVHVLREAPVGWAGPTGFVSEELLRQQIPDFVQRRFYLCGPPPMVEALKKILVQQLGVPVEHIVTEGFAGYN